MSLLGRFSCVNCCELLFVVFFLGCFVFLYCSMTRHHSSCLQTFAFLSLNGNLNIYLNSRKYHQNSLPTSVYWQLQLRFAYHYITQFSRFPKTLILVLKVILIAFNRLRWPKPQNVNSYAFNYLTISGHSFSISGFFHSFVSIVINCRFDKYPKFLTYFKVFDLIALSLLFVRISKVLVSWKICLYINGGRASQQLSRAITFFREIIPHVLIWSIWSGDLRCLGGE